MEKKAVSGILLALLLFGMLTLAFNIQLLKAEPRIITVPDDYPTIQEAIDAASQGDTIFVSSGTYYEHVAVNKNNLTLIGENMDTTVIDALGAQEGVRVTKNFITFEGFTVKNATVGISIVGRRDVKVAKCIFTSINLIGIDVHTRSSNILIANNILKEKPGVSYDGIHVMDSDSSLIVNNTFVNIKGMEIQNSKNITVVGNDIVNSSVYEAMRLLDSSNNVLLDNIIASSAVCHGIILGNSSNNVIAIISEF